MPVVNFSVPKTLDVRIKHTLTRKGFSSKAELFRFAVMKYLDEQNEQEFVDEETFSITKEIEKQLAKKINFDKLPSVKEQLSRFKDV